MKRALAIALSLVLCVTMLAACSNKNSGSKVIKLGVIAPLTGTNKEYGTQFQVGMTMAVEEINNAGGTSNGYTFELVVQDSKGEPKDAADLARQFADDPSIYAILGDFTSGCSMAAAPIIDEAGIVLLSPTASSPDYAPMSPYCFSIQGLQSAEAPYNAEFVMQGYLKASKVAVIYVNSDWGNSAFTNFKNRADEIGLEIVEAVNYVQDEKDFSSLITKLRAANPDAVVIQDQGAVPQIINQIRSAGWDIQLMAQGPSTNDQVIELTGENSEGLVTTSPFFWDYDNPVHASWVEEFKNRANFTPTFHGACAYDTVIMMKVAIEAFGSNEVTRDGIRENLENIKGFSALTGPIEFQPAGDVLREYLIAQVIDGKWTIVQGFASQG